MALTNEQMRYLRTLSDTELYQEAVEFVKPEQGLPLPNTQMNGLLNVAQASTYKDLLDFVKHQRDRSWQRNKAYIGEFYEALERVLKGMPERAKSKGLVSSDLSVEQTSREVGELSGLLACEFIQHLAAENGIRERERQEEEERERAQRRLDHD